jgi:hypothetical protein
MKLAYLALIALLPTIGCSANVSSGSEQTPQAEPQANLHVDPALYTQTQQSYDTNMNQYGWYCNPFPYDPNDQFAVASHEGQWALLSDGVTKGCFDVPYTKFGVTKYMLDLGCTQPTCTCVGPVCQ